jgi:hypothetical protein
LATPALVDQSRSELPLNHELFNILKNKLPIGKVVGLNPAIAERSKTNNIHLDQKEQINL